MKTNKQLKALAAYALAYPQSIVVSVSQTNQQAQDAMTQTRKLMPPMTVAIQLRQQDVILLHNGSKIKFMSVPTGNLDKLRGYHVDAITFSSLHDQAQYLFWARESVVIQ